MHSSAGQTLPVRIPAAVAMSSPDSFTLSEFEHQDKEKLRSRSQGRRGSLTPEVQCDSRGQNREDEGEGAQGSGLEARGAHAHVAWPSGHPSLHALTLFLLK